MKNIYSLFMDMFGPELYQFLAGYGLDEVCSAMSGIETNYLITIGLVTLGVTLLVTSLYYFINHASFNKVGSWFVMMLVVAVISFIIGFSWSYSLQDIIPSWCIYGIENMVSDGTTDCLSMVPMEGATEQITTGNFLLFGLTNTIIAIIFFFIFSIILKRFSVNCCNTPWKSLWP